MFGDDPVLLRPTGFDVLLYLVEHPLRVVGKDELLDAVWAGRTVEESNLSQSVFWLRNALAQCGGAGAEGLIVTARGRGYRFTVEPTWAPADGGEAAISAARDTPPSRPAEPAAPPEKDAKASGRRRRLVGVAAGAGSVAVVLAGLMVGGPPLLRRGVPARTGNSVVLADFRNETHDPIFDRSLADVLRIDLGQSPYINVVSEKRARDTLVLMKKPADAPLTAALAQEICVRANANTVLGGGLAAFGSRYVLTLIATDCSGQRTLAAEKADVANREAVVPALDGLIAKIRSRLGEPAASVDRFNVPLAAEKTGSLDALKAYSEGVWMVNHGRRPEGIQLEQRAIELDPDFEMAYAVLGASYYNIFDYKDAKLNISKAYALRKNVNERSQMRISVLYDQVVSKNYDAERMALAEGLALYPKDDVNWVNFANLEALTGHFDKAITYAQRAIDLNPQLELPYSILARADLGAGLPKKGLQDAQSAIRRGLAGEATHRELMRIAWDMRDSAAFEREKLWADQNPPAFSMKFVEGEVAWSQGRIKEGSAIFDEAYKLSKQQSVSVNASAYEARLLVDLGLPAAARARLALTDDHEDTDYLFALAELNEPERARQTLLKLLGESPSDTMLNNVFAPEIRAVLALREGKPLGAVEALQPALPFRARSPEVDYLLAAAYLAAGDGRRAAEGFERIRAHQGWYPETPLCVLASLGLARALVLTHDLQGARRAYQTLFADWKNADPDLPILNTARAEYDRLR